MCLYIMPHLLIHSYSFIYIKSKCVKVRYCKNTNLVTCVGSYFDKSMSRRNGAAFGLVFLLKIRM